MRRQQLPRGSRARSSLRHGSFRRPRTLGVESLEPRLAPASNIVYSNVLQFQAKNDFEQLGTQYSIRGTNSVEVGYKPLGAETFTPLLRVDMQDVLSDFTIETNPGTPYFEIDNEFTIQCVALSGSSVPVFPLVQNTDEHSSLKIDIPQLISTNGFSLPSDKSLGFTVAQCEVTPGTLYLANPDEKTTVNAEVELQGRIDLTNLGALTKGVTGAVNGTNYVIASAAGLELTGLKLVKSIPTDAVFKGFGLSGTLSIEYDNPRKVFTFEGTVGLTSRSNDYNETALENVTVGLNLKFSVESGVQFVGGGFTLGGKFLILGLEASTPPNQSLSFSYNNLDDQFEVAGGLTIQYNQQSLTLNLGSSTAPGIIFQDGHLTQFNGYVAADFTLWGLRVSTTGLTVMYQDATATAPSEIQIYGSLSLTIPSSGTDTVITANLGQSTDPGFVIAGGALQSVNIGLDTNRSLSVFGLTATIHQANVIWRSVDNTFIVSGDFSADFKIFKVTFDLGNDPTTGLIIENGKWVLEKATISLSNVDLKVVQIQSLTVSWQSSPTEAVPYTITVDGTVTMSGGITVHGDLQLVDGAVNYIMLSYTNPNGIAIGDTGAFLTDLSGSLNNLEDPAHIVVTAHMGIVYGEQFAFLSNEVYLFRATGDVTVDASQLLLSGSVLMGAYSKDNGQTWNAAAGQGDLRLLFDWADGIYSVHLDVDGLFAIFDLSGDLTIRAGQEVDFLATVTAVVPPPIPFIGGDTIGGLGFFFQHVFQHGTVQPSTTVAGWISIQIIWSIEVGFQVVWDANGNAHSSFIGNSQIDNFQRETELPQNQNYTYTIDLSNLVPANSTYLTYSVDWARVAPGVTIVGQPSFTVINTYQGVTTTTSEASFQGTNISLINNSVMATPTKKSIQIVGSTTNSYQALLGDYKLQVTFTTTGGNPFPHFAQQTSATLDSYADQLRVGVTHHLPLPTFGPLNSTNYQFDVPPAPDQTFSVTIKGNMDTGLIGGATVKLYRVLVADPLQTPTLLGTATPIHSSTSDPNWQVSFPVSIDGLYPTSYALYAKVDDTVNAPTKSLLSATFTPVFAVYGSVANQNHDVISGWNVYLDYNNNGIHEKNEPITQTNVGGLYGFTPTFPTGSGYDPVPTGKPFNVQLEVPTDHYIPAQNPISIVYDGSDSENVNFTANEKSSIKGTVFLDTTGTGIASKGQAIGSAVVYIDSNGNGRLDVNEQTVVTDSSGHYTLYNAQPGTYTVRYLPTAAPVVDAISAPAGTPGSGPLRAYTFGEGFTTREAVEITSLGVFGGGAVGGLKATLTATLYDAATGLAMASIVFTPQDSGTAAGAFSYKPLATPIRVYPGFRGVIAASGFTASSLPGDPTYTSNPAWSSNTDAGLIGYTGKVYATAVNQLPTIAVGAPGDSPYAAGSFQFHAPTPVVTTPGSGSYTVTIDNSGIDLSEHNDFGVGVPATIAGTVTSTTNQPLGGVVIQALRNGFVVASTTSSPTGSYSLTDLDPGTYLLQQVLAPNTRQVAPLNPNIILSQPTLGQDAFQLPSAFVGAGFVPIRSMIADFDANGVPDFAILVANPTAYYGVGLPDLFIYYNGGTSNPTVLNSSGNTTTPAGGIAGAMPVAFGFDANSGYLVVLYQNGSTDQYQRQGNTMVLLTTSILTPVLQNPGTYTDMTAVLVQGGMTALVASYTTGSGYGLTPFQYGMDAPSAQATSTAKLNSGVISAGLTGPSYDTSGTVLVGNASSSPILYKALIDTPFTNATPITALPARAGTSYFAAGDINGDGLTDLAEMSDNGQFVFVLQNASGGFPTAATVPTAAFPGPGPTLLIDLNGDGKPDLLTLSEGQPSNGKAMVGAINTGTGPSYFSAPGSQFPFSLAGDPSKQGHFSVSQGDLNGDGLPDLIVIDGKQGIINIFRNLNGLVRQSTVVTTSYAQTSVLNYQNLQYKNPDVSLTIPSNIPSGDYTVSYRAGNLVVTDSQLGPVLIQPLAGTNSLTITAPSGGRTVTLDVSRGVFSLPGGIHLVGSATGKDNLWVRGSDEAEVFVVGSHGLTVDGRAVADWTNLDELDVLGQGGDDQFAVTGTPQVSSAVLLWGGNGHNSYRIASTGGKLAVVDTTPFGTLDFQHARAGVTVNLSLDQGQTQAIGGGNELRIFGSIANVDGSPFNDVILGNVLSNAIHGWGGDDVLMGGLGSDLLDGGDGNDVLLGGSGNSILIGGPGDDTLRAGPGRNILIGGVGRDAIQGYPASGSAVNFRGGSILVGRATIYDANEAALHALMAEWASNRPRTVRIANLTNGSGTPRRRLNGNIFLDSRAIKPEPFVNAIMGNRRYDWLRAGRSDRAIDPVA